MTRNHYLYACLLAGFTSGSYADFSALDQQVKFFDSWVVACNNQRECSINSLPPKPAPAPASTAENAESLEQLGFYLALERKGLVESSTKLSVQDWSDEGGDFEEGESLSLMLDKQTFQLGKLKAKQVSDAAFAIPSEKTSEILAALRIGKQLEVKVGDSVLPVNLQGFTSSLQYIDEQQQRVDTPTALVKKGDKPFTAKALALETLKPIRLKRVEEISVEKRNKIQEVIHQLTSTQACLAKAGNEDPFSDVIEVLDKDHYLIGIKCTADDFNRQSLMLVAPKDKPEQAKLAQFDQGVDDALLLGEYPWYTASDGSLLSHYRKSDLGDCGSTAEWTWNGSQFVLSRYDTMPECRGLLSSMNVWKLKVDK
ncbi:MAG TPA: DUF1176 domain-containing protein [Thiolinea sp.]|nr:DUF1176 domain-containing protein [Thiolinea sp.]